MKYHSAMKRISYKRRREIHQTSSKRSQQQSTFPMVPFTHRRNCRRRWHSARRPSSGGRERERLGAAHSCVWPARLQFHVPFCSCRTSIKKVCSRRQWASPSSTAPMGGVPAGWYRAPWVLGSAAPSYFTTTPRPKPQARASRPSGAPRAVPAREARVPAPQPRPPAPGPQPLGIHSFSCVFGVS